MKVETSTCKKVVISDLISSEFKLDPVTVFLEDYEPGKGKITIECYGQSWSAYWGGMSGDDVATFFCRCDESYLSGNLSRISSSIPDYSALPALAKKEIIRSRRAGGLDSYDARELFNDAERLDVERESELDQRLMHSVFGDDWWYCIPEKENPDYQYLCRIIGAVQAGLKQAGIVKKREAA